MATAGEDLRDLIKTWAQQSPDIRTTPFLEKKSGIDYSTVSRIWNGKNPECQTALAILNVVASKPDGLKYLKMHFPQAAKFHEREYTTAAVVSDVELVRPAVDSVLSFLIMNLAFANLGTREYIKLHYGLTGIGIADDLVRSERLRWDGDKLKSMGHEEFFTYESKADLVRVCQHIIALSAGDNGSPVALIGSLTDSEHEKLKSIIREFCHATKELIYSSKGGENLIALATVYVNLLGGVEQ